jgi:tetratricopeptide (TPR) repeat protein
MQEDGEANQMHNADPHKSLKIGRGLAVLFFFAITSVTQACLWDWDTLQMERRRFPGTLEIITGEFVRHSPAYYEWRIQDRTKRMRSPEEDPALADDLAVAYSKLGRHVEAIALLEQVLAAHPDRYESLANLGTIHMLAGDLKVGKEYVDRAIVINPNAHFGREKYQSLLAEYFLTQRKSPHPAAQWPGIAHPKGQVHGFAKFVLEKAGHGNNLFSLENSKDAEDLKAELAAAQRGVLGTNALRKLRLAIAFGGTRRSFDRRAYEPRRCCAVGGESLLPSGAGVRRQGNEGRVQNGCGAYGVWPLGLHGESKNAFERERMV